MRLACLVLLLTGCASAPPYAHCGGETSCAMGTCTEVAFTRTDGTSARGDFCSSACTTDADCPDEGACIALGHDPSRTFFCVLRCTVTTDCATPFACTMLTADGATFGACLP
jgi:hypothetical protein